MKDCVCRVVQKVQWNSVAIVSNERLCTMDCAAIVTNEKWCMQGSAKVTMVLWCKSSK